MKGRRAREGNPRRMGWAKSLLTAAAFASGAVLTLTGGLPAQGSDIVWRDISMRTQAGDTVAAQLGEIRVPANRDRPDGPTLPLRFVRFPSRHPNPGAPVVYLAGGPGGSGIAASMGSRWPLFDSLRAVADVIALDQRGTGSAYDLPRCTTGEPVPAEMETNRENLSRVFSRQVHHCEAFWDSVGVDLRVFNTAASADDVNDLRAALGVAQVHLWGISYGTHLALAVLKRHPATVGRLVLVSAEGLDQSVKSPAAGDAFFQRVEASVHADPEARGEYPDVISMIRRVLAEAEARPPRVRIETSRGPMELILGAFEIRRLAADRISDPDGTAVVLEAFKRADQGDWTGFGRWAQRITGEPIFLSPMSLATEVASGASEARRRRVAEEARTAILGDALGWPVLHLNGALTELDLGDEFRRPFQSTNPVLFVSGTLDGRTYIEEHREIATQFDSPVHLTVVNGGHNTVLESEEVRSTIVAFLAGETLDDRTIEMPAPRWVPPRGL